MKRYGSLLLVGATLALGWAWLSARDARQRETGRADLLAAQLDSVTAQHEAIEAERAARDSLQRAEIQRLQVQYQGATRRFAAASIVSESLSVALESHLVNDTTAAAGLIRETVNAYQAEVAACGLAVASCEAIQVRQDSVIQRQDSSLRDLRSLHDATHQALQVERRRARPGILRRVEMALPLMGVTALVTLLLAR